MKKILSTTAIALIIGLTTGAMAAGFENNGENPTGTAFAAGGFQGPGLSVSTVADALNMSDDTAVILEGKIEKSLGKEKYVFKDQSGSVTVEIDNEDWNGMTVTPQDIVILKGEVDKDFLKTEIDVDVVQLKK